MKPIIVTYSNESYIIRTEVLLRGIFNSYYCMNIKSRIIKRIFESDIKLIARPKNKTTC